MSVIGFCATPKSIAACATAHGHDLDQPRVERRGDDVVGAEVVADPAIGRGDFLGHRLARQLGQRMGGGDLHLLVDPGRAHVERAAEDEREAEHVVDLVGIVRAAGGDDRVGARRLGLGRGDLGIGIGHGEDDRAAAPCPCTMSGLSAPAADRPRNTSAPTSASLSVRAVGGDGMRRLPLVEVVAARCRSRPCGRT